MNIINVAADKLNMNQCFQLAFLLKDKINAIKVHELCDAVGVQDVVTTLKNAGVPKVWVDYKLNDTPDTVRLRAKAIAKAGADIITVHALGGVEMMKAAMEGAAVGSGGKTLIYAITLLTSLTDDQVRAMFGADRATVVLRLAQEAKLATTDGIVCSAREVKMLATEEFRGMDLVVPGVRSLGQDTHDQKCVETPATAMRDGATHLVIGREITQAADPVAELERILNDISNLKGA